MHACVRACMHACMQGCVCEKERVDKEREREMGVWKGGERTGDGEGWRGNDLELEGAEGQRKTQRDGGME